jgi:serine/threonine-protein kinase
MLDFGRARSVHASSRGDAESTKTLKEAGTVIGTPACMSREQASGESGNARADGWAFGCVLYEMLAGRGAFEGVASSETIAAMLSGSPDWSRLPAGVPPAVRVVLRRCLGAAPILTTTAYLRGLFPLPDGRWLGFSRGSDPAE